MTDPWKPPQPGQQPQYGYPPTQYAQWAPMGDGPPGKVRPTGKVVLLTVVTFGIYAYVYNYKVHDEMKQHSGRGVGGGIALLLTFIAGVAMLFVTPSEVGNLYLRKGRRALVNGWTGLWVIGFGVAAYVGVIITIATAPTTTGYDEYGVVTHDPDLGPGRILALVVLGMAFVAGSLIWVIKTNGALNRYWQSLERGELNAPPPTPGPTPPAGP
ncbi:MAG: hypothetical protein JWO12_1279 [Frankiales bacterium]|nr:hypothetical protein [Frankiales bacterium]